MTTETEISFADIGLSADILTALETWATKSRPRSSNNVFRTCLPDVMSWVWHRQVVVKRRHSACRY